MTKRITIHRALAELKLIDSKIEKLINLFEPVSFQISDKPINNREDKKEFEKRAKYEFQSITDLIENKVKIKNAIVQANSITKITVGEKEMTIAEALNYKNIIGLKKILFEHIDKLNKNIKASINIKNEHIERDAFDLAKDILKKDDIRTSDKDVIKITQPYIDSRELKLIDPLSADELTKNMYLEIVEFESQIDSILSEINAITFIDI